MSIKSDRWIRRMAEAHRMIDPFAPNQLRPGTISYGVSSYGYDMRVAPEFKIFTNALSAVVDPKHFDPKSFVEFTGDVCIVPPNSFALARSVEYFRIPRNVLTICVGKSTYARCGIITNVTPFEPEWEGFVTLEISNTTPLPARIYANEGIAQVLFFTAGEGDQGEREERRDAVQGLEVREIVQHDLESRPCGHRKPGRADVFAVALEPDPYEGGRVDQPEHAQGEVSGERRAPSEIALQLDRAAREHRRAAQHPQQLAAARGPVCRTRIQQPGSPTARGQRRARDVAVQRQRPGVGESRGIRRSGPERDAEEVGEREQGEPQRGDPPAGSPALLLRRKPD